MANAEAITNEVLQLLYEHGEGDYIGESISQLEHCLQCAQLAASAGADEETIIAALLHDIGQFLPTEQANEIAGQAVMDMTVNSNGFSNSGSRMETVSGQSSNSVGRVGHDKIGATFLAHRKFSSKVCSLVGAHVAAKRYLCAMDSSYHDTLSDASKKSLIMQGGPMSEKEMSDWRKSGLTDEMCSLRKWDDAAKIVGLQVPNLETWRPLIQHHLESRT